MTDKLKEIIQRLLNVWRESLGWTCFPGVNDFACPVPFFGRIVPESGKDRKPLIFTLGVNPSNREFLTDKGGIIKKSRFPNISKKSNYAAADLFYACCEYFAVDNNPYKVWFGKQTRNEALLNCFHASYYDNDKQYQAVHIDLMPFPTLCKFSTIQENPFFNLLIANYGIPLIARLIKDYRPKMVICIGKFSCESLLDIACQYKTGNEIVKIYSNCYAGTPFVGSSIYYPNTHSSVNIEDLACCLKCATPTKKIDHVHSGIDFSQVLSQYL